MPGAIAVAGQNIVARRYIFRNSLAAGEVAPDYLMRTDAQARNEAAKTATNVQLLQGGGYRRRWGTRDLVGLTGDARIEALGVGADDAKVLVFLAGKFQVRNQDGSLVQEVTGAPWSVDDLRTMQITIEDERIVVTSRSFFPQILKYGTSWALSDLEFTDGLNGGIKQPYWRFADRGVTLSVSAYSGSVSLETSASFFVADHVGARIRYVNVEIEIDAVTDGTHATGTVVGSIYPTINVNVTDSSGFLVGQVVQGDDSQISGVVSSVPDSTHIHVALESGYSYFDWTSSTVNEKIVGPTARVAQGAAAPTLVSTPASTVNWDEQMISAARGYPGACVLHRNRLLLGDFPQAKNAFVASTIGDVTDFDVGTGLDTDAIIERIGRDNTLGIKHFGSTEQLLIFTELGPFYVPEQVGAPLSATNLELLKIGPEYAGTPTPLLVSEGMLFVENNSGRVMTAIPTGNVRRSWEIADLSELAFHMMGTPIEIELLASTSESDRLVTLLRDDGQIAALAYRRAAQFSAWVRWQTEGAWRSVVSCGGKLFAVARRTIGGVTKYRLEVFDSTAIGDGTVSLATLATAATQYADQTVSVWSNDCYIGDFEVDGSGVLVGVPDSYSAVEIGFDFTDEVALVPPIDPTMGLNRKIRICRVDLDVIQSAPCKVNGYNPSGFSGSAVGGDIPLTTDVRRYRLLGRSKTETASITQDHGGPLQVRSITLEVTS